MKIISVVGARPNFMKIAPIMDRFSGCSDVKPLLVHTGQHFDDNMSAAFFEQLEIPRPDVNLDVGSGTHAVQTAEIMKAFEPVVEEFQPDAVLVVGDVNSTVACGLVAKKLGVKLIHVEAGLRSFDMTMPEEINRIMTDSVTDLFFCTEGSGKKNLLNEGHDSDTIFLVGNVMIDTLQRFKDVAVDDFARHNVYGVEKGDYAVMTLHRPSNVDDADSLNGIIGAIEYVVGKIPVIFPIHPRTLKNIERFGLKRRLDALADLHLVEPLGYLPFLSLVANSRVVLSDSGGIQEETTILRVPCLTLRENTERPVTCEIGTNQLVGSDPERIKSCFDEVMMNGVGASEDPPFWDGHAAERIVEILREKLVI